MSANARKFDVETARAAPPEGAPTGDVEPSIVVGGDGALSPARALQDRLHVHFSPVGHKMSSRFVTLLIMFTFLGTWVSGIGLYGTL